MKIKILKGVAYTLFFLLCLAFFVVQGFPVQLVADRVTQDLRQRHGIKLTTGSLTTSFPAGVRADEVRLVKESPDDTPGLVIPIERLDASISLLGLLAGRRDVSYRVELFSGRVEGEARLAEGDKPAFKATLSELDLAKLPVWKDLLGLELAGRLSGVVDLELDPKDMRTATGTVGLSLEQGVLGEGSIKGLSIPRIALGRTQLDVVLAKGKADIRTFKVQSDDLEASLAESYLLLQKDLGQTNARGKVRFRLTEDFLAKNPKFKDIIQLAGLNQARADDGFFSYQVFGRIDHMQFRPQRGGGGTVRPGGSPLLQTTSKPNLGSRPDLKAGSRSEARPGPADEPPPDEPPAE